MTKQVTKQVTKQATKQATKHSDVNSNPDAGAEPLLQTLQEGRTQDAIQLVLQLSPLRRTALLQTLQGSPIRQDRAARRLATVSQSVPGALASTLDAQLSDLVGQAEELRHSLDEIPAGAQMPDPGRALESVQELIRLLAASGTGVKAASPLTAATLTAAVTHLQAAGAELMSPLPPLFTTPGDASQGSSKRPVTVALQDRVLLSLQLAALGQRAWARARELSVELATRHREQPALAAQHQLEAALCTAHLGLFHDALAQVRVVMATARADPLLHSQARFIAAEIYELSDDQPAATQIWESILVAHQRLARPGPAGRAALKLAGRAGLQVGSDAALPLIKQALHGGRSANDIDLVTLALAALRQWRGARGLDTSPAHLTAWLRQQEADTTP